jgi:hypothetical protein
MIQFIEDLQISNDNTVVVTAMIEDAVLVYEQTMLDPAEYGPAMCKATFDLNEDDVLPEDEEELKELLEDLELNWEPMEYHPFNYEY